MKKIGRLLGLLILPFLLTGCIKYNVNMDIRKDKSMDFSIVYAINEQFLSDGQTLLDEEELKKVKDSGFEVKDYSQDNMVGFQLSKKIKNIDLVSDTKDSNYSLSKMDDVGSKDSEMFKVKKGFFKNTYTAKFKFDASDSDLNNENALEGNNNTVESNNDNDIDDSITITNDNDNDFGSDADFDFEESDDEKSDTDDASTNLDSDFDLSKLGSGMDLSFNVTLPYSAKSSNASSSVNDGKSLTWNLTSSGQDAIEFEFYLYNWTNIYIGIGLIVFIIVVLVVIIIKKGGKKNRDINSLENVSSQVVQNDVESVHSINIDNNVQSDVVAGGDVNSSVSEMSSNTNIVGTEVNNNVQSDINLNDIQNVNNETLNEKNKISPIFPPVESNNNNNNNNNYNNNINNNNNNNNNNNIFN